MSSASSQNVVISLPSKVLGGSDAVDFSDRIRALISAGEREIVIDLGAVELMNSSGLGMLTAGHSTLKRAGGNLHFRNVPEVVSRLFRMTHLDKVFHIEDDTQSQQKS